MSIQPSRGDETILEGIFSFSAQTARTVEVRDSFNLRIVVPAAFPRALPEITETGRKIPRDGKHHVNWDGTLCLGSPLRLLVEISKRPDMVGFAENCLVPYLHNISHKLQWGGDFVFGELAHGNAGIFQDYRLLFGVDKRDQILSVLGLLGLKRRLANKRTCPCGCGKRLGGCRLHVRLNLFRRVMSRSWFRSHAKALTSGRL